MNQGDTKLDLVIRRIKNHRLTMWLLLGSLALVGLGHISDALAKVAALVNLSSADSMDPHVKSERARKRLAKASIAYDRKHFMDAISRGEYEVASLFLAAGMDPNVAYQGSKTALLQATLSEHADLVRLLLEMGAEVDRTDANGITPLMFAALHGDEDTLRLLIAHGASVTKRDKHSGLPPLIYAVIGCSHSAVEILLDAQADANARDEDGDTVLMYAVNACDNPEKESQLRDIIMSLVVGGADLEAKDDEGKTAHDYAKEQGRIATFLTALAEHKRES